MIYFLRITPMNLAYAWWLSLRQPVGVWNLEVPELVARRFERLKPYRLFNLDEWQSLRGTCFEQWKQSVFPAISRSHRCVWHYNGRKIDFSRNLWQVLGAEYERMYLFIATVSRHAQGAASRPHVVEPWFAQCMERGAVAASFPGIDFHDSRLHRWLENGRERALNALHLGFAAFQFAASLFAPRRRLAPKPIAWDGISAQEIPDRDYKLNFAWATQYQSMRKEDILYVLPCRTSAAQHRYLSSLGVHWVEPQQMYRLLPLAARLRVLGGALRALLTRASNGSATAGTMLARFAPRAGYWSELVETLGVRSYYTTISQAWPERPELAAVKAHGVGSVNWAYSANSLQFAVHNKEFRDVGVSRSVAIADEYWVWSEAYRQWLGKRQADNPPSFEIRVTGPLMCGNSGWLSANPAAVRSHLGVIGEGVCIGVFDMPRVSDEWRDRYGGGVGLVEFADYELFCEAILAILDQVPGCFVLMKMKREIGALYRDFPKALERLIDAKGDYVKRGRVFVVDVNIDPYIPVAASDIAIGMTYTSPILAVRALGRASVFFDPRGRANFPPSPGLRELTIQSLDQLIDFVGAAVRGSTQPKALTDKSVIPPMPFFPHS